MSLASSNSPTQSLSVYYLSSVVPNLLATALEHVDLMSTTEPGTALRLFAFFEKMMQAKADIYLDLLDVVAYHSEKARYGALLLLARYWPRALGHNFVSRPLNIQNEAIAPSSPDPHSHKPSGHAHQFIGWHFPSGTPPSQTDCLTMQHCSVWKCRMPIKGFGLFCPFCFCAVHLDCYDYPDGYLESHYRSGTDDTGKIVIYRFCDVALPQSKKDIGHIRLEQHHFRLTNLFSLTLCFHCREPLWGYAAQAYRCITCRHFAHRSCLKEVISRGISFPRCRSLPLDASHITVEYDVLRHSFVQSHQGLLFTEADLDQRTFEEISVLYAVLWLEMQILEHGSAQSSIAVCRNGSRLDKLDEFELHYCVKLYEAYLSSGRLRVSGTLSNYAEENDVDVSDYPMFFDWSTLTYITTIIKTPYNQSQVSGDAPLGFLSVDRTQLDEESPSDPSNQPIEVTNLTHLRDALGYEVGLHSDDAARCLLEHLHHLGFIAHLDGSVLLFPDSAIPKEVQCAFPLPLGLDLSSEVETLFGAVEACLSDVNLSVNEAGFLFLVRRLWPNGMATEYALRRLARAVIAWIVAEVRKTRQSLSQCIIWFSQEMNAARVIKEFVSMRSALPGMRSGSSSQQAWPLWPDLRVGSSNVAPSGNDYSRYRQELRRKYAAPWMLAFRNKDSNGYCRVLREICDELAEESIGGPSSNPEMDDLNVGPPSNILPALLKLRHSQ
jgi:hypothetical protein